MFRLIHKRRLHHTSTGVADPVHHIDVDIRDPSFHTVAVLDSDTWEEVKLDQSLVSQMQETARSLQRQRIQVKTSEASSRPSVAGSPTASPVTQSASPESSTTAEVDRPAVLPAKPVGSSLVSKFLSAFNFRSRRRPVSIEVTQAVSSAVKRHGGYAKFNHLLKRRFSLYLRDAGGQVEFQEMVSLLIIGPSIFFFVFRADQDLKSTFLVGYRTSATEAINSYPSSITTEEALLQCLASVYAMDTPTEAGHDSPSPHVFIVATHKDKLGPSADQKLHQLNEEVKSLIKESGFESLVQYADRAKGQVMFAVDNTSESDDDFKPIRSQVHDLVVNGKEFTVKYPFSYLLFCLELQSDQRSVLTLEECRAMAAKYKIVGDKVSHLLYFLHQRIGLIHFVNIKGVRCVAMKRPEDLFNKVTDLVVKTFSANCLSVEEAEELKKGILTESAFERVVSGKDEAFTASEFLKILVHLRIVAEFTRPGDQEKRYFIPCVLNHVPEFTGEEVKTDVMSLAVKFKCKHCPKGLFGVLVTHLMASHAADEKESDSVSFTLIEDKIFKDQVSLYVETQSEQDVISLTLQSTHLELRFFPEDCSSRNASVSFVCNGVRERILESIVSSLDNLHYKKPNVEPVICIKCANCSQFHQVKGQGTKFVKIYCEQSRKGFCVPPQAGYWWGK